MGVVNPPLLSQFINEDLMNIKTFDRLTRIAMDPVCEKHNFSFIDGIYYRRLPTEICHLLIIDFDTRSKRAFRVYCGLNSVVLTGNVPANEMGAYYALFMTRGGLSSSPTNWPCVDESGALAALSEVAALFEEHAIAWFDAHRTLSSFANELRGEDQDYLKGKLYLNDGDVGAAKENLRHYLGRLSRMAQTDDVKRMEIEINEMLSAI